MKAMSYHDMSDEQLVDLSRRGDNMAFGMIVERYQGMVARTVKGMLGDAAFAEDIGQDAFVRLYRSLNDFRGEAKLSTYLNRIAVNLTLNEIKRRKSHGSMLLSTEEGEGHLRVISDEDDSERRDTKELMNKALAMLEPKFRIVVVMRLLEGYSTKETAGVLKVPQGTVLSRLSRAQDQLKEILERLK